MGSAEPRQRRDWIMVGLLFLIALVLAVPFRSRIPYHWDSAEFTLAVTNYDVRLSQPHAPGYFLYVMLGKLVNFAVRGPHESLVWISIVAGGGLAATIYFIGAALFDKRTGMIAGLLAATSPSVWFHSCVALTYELDAFLVAVLVFGCWRAGVRGCRWSDVIMIAVLLTVLGGVRPQTAPALLPLVAYTLWQARPPRLAKLVVCGLITAGLGLCWLLPMISQSGGWATFMELVRRHRELNASRSVFGGGWAAVGNNLACVAVFCWNGLGLATIPLLGTLFYRAHWMNDEQRREWDGTHRRALVVLALWIVPLVLLGTFGVTQQPGYVLDYLTALLLLAAVAIAALRQPLRRATAAVVIGSNAFIFLAWPAAWDAVFWHAGRTAREIRQQDARWSHWTGLVRGRYDPKTTIVCFADWSAVAGVRHAQVWLPEFVSVQLGEDPTMLAPSDRPLMAARDGKLAFLSLEDVKRFPVKVLVVLPHWQLQRYARSFDISHATLVAGADSWLFELRSNQESVP